MAHAKQLMRVDRSTLFLHDAAKRELWSQVADGAPRIRIPDDAGIAGAACRSRKVIDIADAYADDRFNPDVDRRTGYRTRTVTAYPILNGGGELLGVLQLINRVDDEPLSAHDLEMLHAFSAQVSRSPDLRRHLGRSPPLLSPPSHPISASPPPPHLPRRWRWPCWTCMWL